MRNIFVKQLMLEAEQNSDMYLLTADLGYNSFEPFRDKYPERFINAGAGEAGMIGIAAGLALTGKRVCCYSIAPFITMRVLEQIRNNICYHDLNVNLIGAGGGFNYGPQGFSHNTTEDLAVMRSLPNMAVFAPGNIKEAGICIKQAIDHKGPTYLRLGLVEQSTYGHREYEGYLGQAFVVEDGSDVVLISTGNIISITFETAEIIKRMGLSVKIIRVPCLKPLDNKTIIKNIVGVKAVFTIEEHSEIGGLGSAVAELISELPDSNPIFKRFALADACHPEIGSHDYLRTFKGICSKNISDVVVGLLK